MEHVILIIDDSPAVRSMLYKVLTSYAGAGEIHLAASGQEGLTILEEHPEVDCIICDWMMPEMSGIDFLRQLRAQARWRRIPCIMLTAKDSHDDIQQAIDAGANDYVIKPFRADLLVKKVRQQLAILDRRKVDRVAMLEEYRVSIHYDDGATQNGQLVDLSHGGCLVVARSGHSEGFAILSLVQIELEACGESLLLPAQLLRIEADRERRMLRMAFEFQWPEDGGESELSQRLESMLERCEERWSQSQS